MLWRLLSSFLIAARMVRRNKLRAGLTVIGITIGIAAVVTMIALGQGAPPYQFCTLACVAEYARQHAEEAEALLRPYPRYRGAA